MQRDFEAFLSALPKTLPPLRGGPPDWLGLVDTEADAGNPETERVEQLIRQTPALRRLQLRRLRLVERFQAVLPEELIKTWLAVEESYNLRDCVHTCISYGLGVEAGQNMSTVESGLRDGNVDTSEVGQDGLFVLTTVLAQLAQRIPLPRKD